MGLFGAVSKAFDTQRANRLKAELRTVLDSAERHGVKAGDGLLQRAQAALESDNSQDVKRVLDDVEVRSLRGAIASTVERLQQERQEREAEEARCQELEKRQARVFECLGLLDDPSATLVSNCAWTLEGFTKEHKLAVIDEVTGLGQKIERTDISPPRDIISGVFKAGANARTAYKNAEIRTERWAIADRMGDCIAYRPVASFDDNELALARALVHMYGDMFMNEKAFDECWFGFIWAGGVKGKVGIDDQSATGHAAATSMFWLLENRFFKDYDNFLAKVKAMVVEGYNEGPPQLQTKLGNLLDAGNRWMTPTELGASVFRNDEARGLLLCRLDGEPVCYEGPGALLTLAPPRTGKSQGQVIPALLRHEGSAVVLDVKGEIFKETAHQRQSMGQRVLRWNPLDRSGTHRFDVLAGISTDPDYVWSDCQTVAHRLIGNVKGESDPFWRQEARNVLTIHLADMALNPDDGERGMGELLVRLNMPSEELLGRCELKLIPLASHHGLIAMKGAVNGLIGLMTENPRQYRQFVQSAASELRVFESPAVLRSLAGSDWRAEELKSIPTTLYLTVPDENLEMFGPLLRVILADQFKGLQKELGEGSPVTFFLDECGALGNFPELLNAIARGAGYGIRPWMFFQDIGQIEEVYDNPQGILGNVAVRSFMNPQSATAKALSEELGIVKNVLTGKEEPLVRAEALGGPDYADKVIVLGQKCYPILGEKTLAFATPGLRELRGAPPELDYPA